MSNLQKRPNGKWRARYRDAANKQHARHFDTRKAGQRWLDEVTTSVVTGLYVDPNAGRTLLRDYAADWEAAQVGRDATARITDNALRLHILPALGDRPMASIRRSDVQALVKRLMLHPLSPGSIVNVYNTLARLFAAAVLDKVVAETPCRKIALPESTAGEVVPPSVEHVEHLASTMPARYRAVVVLLAGSGLRIGEALGLRVSDVDFLRREVRVERQRLQDGELGPTKTPESVRTVPLGQVVLDELAAHLATHRQGEWLFTTSTGAPLTYSSWVTVWESAQRPDPKATRAQGCPRCDAKPDTRCVTAKGRAAAKSHTEREAAARGHEQTDSHALRHFFASCLISGGASVALVSRLLGHASPVITLKVYSHLWPGDDQRARSLVDAALDILGTGRGLADHG